MAVDDTQLREQLAIAEERLSILHRAASDAVDKLCRLYDSFPINDADYGEESVSGFKVRHLREMSGVARDLAFAIAQQESEA
jgi:hypothetical protein